MIVFLILGIVLGLGGNAGIGWYRRSDSTLPWIASVFAATLGWQWVGIGTYALMT